MTAVHRTLKNCNKKDGVNGLFFTFGATYSKCFHNEWFQNCLQCCRYVHVLSNPCRWVSICDTSFLLHFPEKSELKIHPCCIRFKILCICIFLFLNCFVFPKFLVTFHNMLHLCTCVRFCFSVRSGGCCMTARNMGRV